MAKKEFKNFLKELDPTPASPGRTCRAFRKNFDLTLKEIEDITGIKEANLSALENDRLEMTSQYAERLAAVFGLHPSLILYPTGWVKKSPELSKIQRRAEKVLKAKQVG